MDVVTRFAPSPTGYLHIGGVRTALFCWLFARRHGGRYLLRIEDTDRERSTDEAVQVILDRLHWLGLEPDEPPVYQTGRFDRYREVLAELLDRGQAYHCYCTAAELEQERERQRAEGLKPRYSRRCRDHPDARRDGIAPVVRFRTPLQGEVVFNDAVKGEIRVANEELDDLVIARSDGTPTYNFCVVVDDAEMGITHVIRGDDHVNNTPRQINIYRALDYQPPVFAHVPMILGADGARLSKRHGAVSVREYQRAGYLPDALLNYLVRLGWSHGDQEIFSRDELVELFTLEAVNRAPATFNPEKLDWVNQQYIAAAPGARLTALYREQAAELGSGLDDTVDLEEVVEAYRERVRTINEMVQASAFLHADEVDIDARLADKAFKPAALDPMEAFLDRLGTVDDWARPELGNAFNSTLESLGIGFGKLGQPVRVAVSGQGGGPDLVVLLAILGRGKTIQRIEKACALIRQRTGQ